jgi:hypothetical protein
MDMKWYHFPRLTTETDDHFIKIGAVSVTNIPANAKQIQEALTIEFMQWDIALHGEVRVLPFSASATNRRPIRHLETPGDSVSSSGIYEIFAQLKDGEHFFAICGAVAYLFRTLALDTDVFHFQFGPDEFEALHSPLDLTPLYIERVMDRCPRDQKMVKHMQSFSRSVSVALIANPAENTVEILRQDMETMHIH